MRHLSAALGIAGLAAAVALPTSAFSFGAAPAADASAQATAEPRESTADEQQPQVTTTKQKVAAGSSAVIEASGRGDENTVLVFGATWANGTAPKVEYRSKIINADTWTMWRPLESDGEGPDADSHEGATSGSSPINAAYNEKIEVRTQGAPITVTVSTTPVTDADRFMTGGVKDEGHLSSPDLQSPARGPHAGGSVNAGGTASIGGFKYFSRKQWGAKAPRCKVDTVRRNHAVIVHHTEGSNTYRKEQVPGILRGVQSFHQGSRHWCDIGYNILVDRYGNIYEGRPNLDKATVGAHAASVNRGTFGVSALGTFNKPAPQATVNSIARIIAWQSSRWKWAINSKVTLTSAGGETRKYPKGAKMRVQRVSGHRDVGNTDCPGDGLYSQLPDIRSIAQAVQKGKQPPGGGSAIDQFYARNAAKTGAPKSREFHGLPGGGSYRVFARGAVHYSPKTGAHFTRFGSGIQKAWAAQSFERGRLGYPTGEETCGIKDGGCYQAFQYGSVHYSPKIGARKALYSSAIRQAWQRQGFERGRLGYPTTDEFSWGSLKRQDFEGGYVTWSRTQGVKVRHR